LSAAPAERSHRPFRFLAGVQKVVDRKKLAADARRAEAMGCGGLVIPDHLIEKLAPVPRSMRERLGITNFMGGDIDELAPVVERLAGT